MSAAGAKVAWFAVLATLIACGGKTMEIPTPTPTTTTPIDPVDPIDPSPPPSPPTIPTTYQPPSKPPTKSLPVEPKQPDPPDPAPPPTPCQAQPFYLDSDGDGFGVDKTIVISCTAPKGYVAKGGDCFDSNADAHPGQLAFFTKDRGDGSFDYDCSDDAAIELATQEPVYCLCSGAWCSTSGGWVKTVPACGEAGDWNTSTTGCMFTPEKRVQGCR